MKRTDTRTRQRKFFIDANAILVSQYLLLQYWHTQQRFSNMNRFQPSCSRITLFRKIQIQFLNFIKNVVFLKAFGELRVFYDKSF